MKVRPVITQQLRDDAAHIAAINASTRESDNLGCADGECEAYHRHIASALYEHARLYALHKLQVARVTPKLSPRVLEAETEALLRDGWTPRGAWFNATQLFDLGNADEL